VKKEKNESESTGRCKSPIRFEKRVYLSKSPLNLLKTWFLREKPAKMSSKPGFCSTFWFMKVWTKSESRAGLERPKT
jgi:hypothetical protein